MTETCACGKCEGRKHFLYCPFADCTSCGRRFVHYCLGTIGHQQLCYKCFSMEHPTKIYLPVWKDCCKNPCICGCDRIEEIFCKFCGRGANKMCLFQIDLNKWKTCWNVCCFDCYCTSEIGREIDDWEPCCSRSLKNILITLRPFIIHSVTIVKKRKY